MKKIIVALFGVILFISCSSDDIKTELPKENSKDFMTLENLKIVNDLSKEYNYNVKSIKNNEIDKKDIGIINDNYIKLYNNSIEYLINEGGLTNDEILDFFPKEYDQRVIVTAMFLSEYNKKYVNISENKTELKYDIKSSGVGNCVLEAVGINALVTGAGKKIATKVMSRFVPYLGWGLAAADFADCMDWI